MESPIQISAADPDRQSQRDLPTRLLAVFFGIFLFATALSIALAQFVLGLATVVFIWVVYRDRRWDDFRSLKPLFVAWGCYFVWMLVASFVNDRTWSSLNCIREEWLLVIVPIGLHLNRDRAVARRLLWCLAGGLALASAYGIVQHFTGFHILTDQHLHRAGDNYRLSGNFSHPLTYGYYVVTATIFFLTYLVNRLEESRGMSRVLLTLTASLGLIAAALCNSRGPMLAILVGLVFLGLLIGRVRWAIVGIAFVTLVALTLSPGLVSVFTTRVAHDWRSDNPAGRLFIWKQAGAIVADNPVFGCGPGNFSRAYTAHLPPEFAGSGSKGHAHNDFIHLAAVGGLPALLLFLGFLGVAVRRLWRLYQHSDLTPLRRALALAGLVATVTFLAGAMTECTFADEELRQLLYALWALAWAPTNRVG